MKKKYKFGDKIKSLLRRNKKSNSSEIDSIVSFRNINIDNVDGHPDALKIKKSQTMTPRSRSSDDQLA